jgi:membrane peptidoglycan carboxypeptidase
MANAYATLAADGNYCEPLPVVSIKDLQGTSLAAANPRCHRAVPVDVARGAIDAMRCPIGDQSAYGMCDGATAANIRGIVGKPLAGKTGTTDANQTAALIATTRQLAVAGIVADPDWAKTSRLKADLGGRDPHADVVNLAVAHTLHDGTAGKPSLGFPAPSPQMAWGPSGHKPAPPKPSAPAKPGKPGQNGPPIFFPPPRH